MHKIRYDITFLTNRGGAHYEAREARASPLFEIYYEDHFLKSPKYAIKINAKKIYPPEPHQNFKACAATEYTCEEYLSRFEMEFTLMSA